MTPQGWGARTERIHCTNAAFPIAPELLFGDSVDGGIQYFNASRYHRTEGKPKEWNPEDFAAAYLHPILNLSKRLGVDEQDLAVRATDGDLLICSDLLILFMCYSNPEFLEYAVSSVQHMLTDGFCVSDTYLAALATQRMTIEEFTQLKEELDNQ